MTTRARTTETDALLSALAGQQHRIHLILSELDRQAVRRVVLPSGWSCAGMVQHLTLTTTFWLSEVMAGQPRTDHPEDEFAVAAELSTEHLLEAYADAARVGAKLVRNLPLATPPAWWPGGRWGGWRLHSLQEVLLHLLVETSCHAGHLDTARELIDGRTWDYARGGLSRLS